MTEFLKVKRFSFLSEKSGWLAVHRYPSKQKRKNTAKARGSDFPLLDLSNSGRLNIGNVSEFAFDPEGYWLARTVDSTDKHGSGMQIRNN
jgi:hypothetical protein